MNLVHQRKRLLRGAASAPPTRVLMRVAERCQSTRGGLLRVLTYHRVPDPVRFAAHVDWLGDHWRIVGIESLLDALADRAPLPARALLMTFDDGYTCFREHAWPVLRARGLAAALFVPTAYPDRPERVFWWDRLLHAAQHARVHALTTAVGRWPLGTSAERVAAYRAMRSQVKALPHDRAMALVDDLCARLQAPPAQSDVLGWEELRGLAREGVVVGPHTCTHPLLDRVTEAVARDEALASIDEIGEQLGARPSIFAYPGGHYTPAVVAELAAAGVRAAFTTVRGTNDLRRDDPLRLRRIDVGPEASVDVLRARLLQSSPWLNRWHPVPIGTG
ncbi:MAG: polysaccharide deacetylase family protein [Planctomycetota bacterium]